MNYKYLYVLFIYLYYSHFMLVYYTSILYYNLIKHIYEPAILHLPCFHLIICMTVNFSRALVFLESSRSGVYRV